VLLNKSADTAFSAITSQDTVICVSINIVSLL